MAELAACTFVHCLRVPIVSQEEALQCVGRMHSFIELHYMSENDTGCTLAAYSKLSKSKVCAGMYTEAALGKAGQEGGWRLLQL